MSDRPSGSTAATVGPEPGPPPAPAAPPSPPRFSAAAVVRAVVTGNSVVVTVLAIVVAVVIGGLVVAFSDSTGLAKYGYFFAAPGNALAATWHSAAAAYSALFEGSVFNPSAVSAALHGGPIAPAFNPISETLVRAAPLVMAGLSVSLAFRAGLFNIGGQSQVLGGALCAGVVGFAVPLPAGLHVLVALLAGIAGGMAWGYVPGILKARTGAHEVITTIMLNYIAYNLMFYLLGTKELQQPGRTDPISPLIAGNAHLPLLAGSQLRLHAGILLALAAAVGVWWLLERSTLGFELRAVGFNPTAARTAGINIRRCYVLAMVIAGGLAGLAGANLMLGTEFAMTPQIAGNLGFDAITVALLGRASPLGTVLAGLLFGALQTGSVTMQAQTNVPVDLATVIQALIVLFIAAPPFVRAMFRLRGARRGAGTTLARGW